MVPSIELYRPSLWQTAALSFYGRGYFWKIQMTLLGSFVLFLNLSASTDVCISAVIMKNLATAIPPVDNILQCCPGVMALTRFIIITADWRGPRGAFLTLRIWEKSILKGKQKWHFFKFPKFPRESFLILDTFLDFLQIITKSKRN